MLIPRHSEVHGKVNSEFLAFISSAEWFGTEFWEISVPRNSRNSIGTKNHLFRLFRLRRNNFFDGNLNLTVTWRAGPCLSCVIFCMKIGSVHLLYKISWICHQLAAEQLTPGQAVRSGKSGGTNRPSQYKSHLLGHFPQAKLERTPCRANPPW